MQVVLWERSGGEKSMTKIISFLSGIYAEVIIQENGNYFKLLIPSKVLYPER